MPRWTPLPDRGPTVPAYRILRTPHTRPIEMIITSDSHVGTYIHWWNGRSIPCELPDYCEPCERGSSARWHGYLGALLLPTAEHLVWEFTAPILDQLASYALARGTIRGAKLSAKRARPYPTARLQIWIRPADPDDPAPPPAPDLVAILLHLWGLDKPPDARPTKTPTKGDYVHPARFKARPNNE